MWNAACSESDFEDTWRAGSHWESSRRIEVFGFDFVRAPQTASVWEWWPKFRVFVLSFESCCSRNLRILIPDLDGPLHDRGVRRVDPVEQHHVGRLNTKQLLLVKFNVLINWLNFLGFNLGIEGKSNSSEISGEPYYCFPNLRMYHRLHNAQVPPISRCRY